MEALLRRLLEGEFPTPLSCSGDALARERSRRGGGVANDLGVAIGRVLGVCLLHSTVGGDNTRSEGVDRDEPHSIANRYRFAMDCRLLADIFQPLYRSMPRWFCMCELYGMAIAITTAITDLYCGGSRCIACFLLFVSRYHPRVDVLPLLLLLLVLLVVL